MTEYRILVKTVDLNQMNEVMNFLTLRGIDFRNLPQKKEVISAVRPRIVATTTAEITRKVLYNNDGKRITHIGILLDYILSRDIGNTISSGDLARALRNAGIKKPWTSLSSRISELIAIEVLAKTDREGTFIIMKYMDSEEASKEIVKMKKDRGWK